MASAYISKGFQKDGRFHGKVALCTASTAGIGLAVAERLAQEGAKVVLSSRRKEKVEAAVEKLRAKKLEVSGMVCHQAKKEDRQRLIDFVTEQEWDKLFKVNVKSTFLMIRETVPHMNKEGGGAIAINSTIAALYPDAFGMFVQPYAVSKTVLTGLTKVLAPVLAKDNIRINCLAPGPINTQFLEGVYKTFYPDATSPPPAVVDMSFMRRAADPAECGAVVAFLLSDDASFITGEVIPVSGGSVLSVASAL
ncbi:dehydrogenase/reductase SDR family member 4-like isoform X2 [Apostichopus japonicus]|uniref:dehydrogenase/reductase SDR family member 4-like isoform X2 n=1 Tax=Stichopus japonicus TaxID=307972 RepID=UPI003AB59EFF